MFSLMFRYLNSEIYWLIYWLNKILNLPTGVLYCVEVRVEEAYKEIIYGMDVADVQRDVTTKIWGRGLFLTT